MPSPPKVLEDSVFFFIRSPSPLSCPTEWVVDLPTQSILESFKEKAEYKEILHLLGNVVYDTNVLISEDIPFHFRFILKEMKLVASIGTFSSLPSTCS